MLKFIKNQSKPVEAPLTRSDLVLIVARAADIQKDVNCDPTNALLLAAMEEHDATKP